MSGISLSDVIQIIIGLAITIIAFFLKREFKKFDDSITAINSRIDSVDIKSRANIESLEIKMNGKIEKIQGEVNDLKSDLPFIYVTREDFIRSMDNVDRSITTVAGKLDKIYDHMTGKGG